jgi:hypothetical protein
MTQQTSNIGTTVVMWWAINVSLQPEDGDSKVLRNAGLLRHHYTVSQHRRPRKKL